MTTDVSGNSGLDGQSEEKFYGFASMDVLLWKYYELQIRILTSGRSDIEKINRKTCKIHSDENRYVPICYYKFSRFLCQILDIYKTFLPNSRQILNISHIHLSSKGVLQYIAYNVHYAWQQHNLVIFTVTVYISCLYMYIII